MLGLGFGSPEVGTNGFRRARRPAHVQCRLRRSRSGVREGLAVGTVNLKAVTDARRSGLLVANLSVCPSLGLCALYENQRV